MNIHFFAKSDIGRVRAANEDFFLNERIAENEFLFVVADGMGGHQAGDVASRLASETFLNAYRSLRKKGTDIAAAMEQAVRRANSGVFRKAASDVEKRGMGTTFSALVVAGMKGYIAHVGDSRIYLVRRNRIKRLTTDHSFVEKLVEEGRISADEAREHPQKNVLYMSLGARESFSPEMIHDLALEDGDGLLLCSDGLSNMVDDEALLNAAMGDYPEQAAEALVRLANERGGADNITVQIVRLGSLEMLEKTKPIPLARPRRRLAKALALVVLLLLLAVLAFLLFAPDRGAGGTRAGLAAGLVALPQALPAAAAPPRLREIDSARFAGLGLAAGDWRHLNNDRLFAVRGRRLSVIGLAGPGGLSLELGRDEQALPGRGDEIFLLRREPVRDPAYLLLRQGREQALLRIRSHAQVNSREAEINGVSTYRIAGLQDGLTPDYIDSRYFVFHDRSRYYGIKNWRDPDGVSAAIGGLEVAAGGLWFQHDGGRMLLVRHDAGSGRAAVLTMEGAAAGGEIVLAPDPAPLLLEYAGGRRIIAYYPDGCVEWLDGRRGASHRYFHENFQVRLVKVLLDPVNGGKVAIDDGNRYFRLECGS